MKKMETKYKEKNLAYNPFSSSSGIEQIIGMSNSFVAEPEMVTQMRQAAEEAKKYRKE